MNLRNPFRRSRDEQPTPLADTELLAAPAVTAGTETFQAAETPACLCCSDEDYGPCTCTEGCDSIRCTGWGRYGPPPGAHASLAREVIPPGYAPLQPPAPHAPFGEWDTRAAREEAARIFGPRPPAAPVLPTLAEITAEATRQAVISAGERRRIAMEELDRTRSDMPPARPYVSQGDPDQPAALERLPAVASPRSLTDTWGFGGDAGDLRNLPAFRETVSRRTRDQARECLCVTGTGDEKRNTQVPGGTWGERMVCAAHHVLRSDLSADEFTWPGPQDNGEPAVDLAPLPAGTGAAA